MSYRIDLRVVEVLLILAACAPAAMAQGERRGRDASGTIRGFQPGPDDDRVTPGEFFIDPPTLHNLGFRWYIEGDSNRNAAVEVAYRRKGEQQWREALPMLRVQHEVANQAYTPWRCGNLFAGSVMNLEPGTEYEVRLTMTDPDGEATTGGSQGATAPSGSEGGSVSSPQTPPGAAPPKIVTVTTGVEPPHHEGERQLEVFPADHAGDRPNGSYADLAEALKDAQPGDVIRIHPGIHWGSFVIETSGEPDRPIVIRGAEDGSSVVESPHHGETLFDVSRADHIHFEDLTLRRARYAIHGGNKGGAGTAGLVVRRCRIEDVVSGVWTTSENARNWFLADNVLVGMNPTWHPRTAPGRSYMEPSHTGVNIYGRGHVVAYNRITRFSDSLAIANFGPPVDDLEKHCVNIDFHNNDLSWAQDDTIETDYGCHNIRVYRNRCYNTHTALSVQPSYGGPIYLIRNECYGITSIAFKLHNYCTGTVAYHNTTCTARRAGFASFDKWQNGHFRNNLILGPGGALATGSITPYTTLDYNGYKRSEGDSFVRWFDGETRHRFSSLEEFAEATGQERHGLVLDYDVFVRADEPQQGVTSHPDDWDLRLRPGSAAADAGVRLPNVNDEFTGTAPDLGAHELDQPLPHYGPRPVRP
jgi:hypothetical protein